MYLFWTELIYDDLSAKKNNSLSMSQFSPKEQTNGPSEQNCKIEDYCLNW